MQNHTFTVTAKVSRILTLVLKEWAKLNKPADYITTEKIAAY